MPSSQINQVILEGRLICKPAVGIDDNGLYVGLAWRGERA